MIAPFCGHGTLLVVRGLCKPCYQALARLVKSGETTWKALERCKRCAPAKGGKEFLRKPNGEIIRVPFTGAKPG